MSSIGVAEVDDPLPGSRLMQPGERPAEQVVAFELDVGERHDLGQEAVDAHEPGEDVAELVLRRPRRGR